MSLHHGQYARQILPGNLEFRGENWKSTGIQKEHALLNPTLTVAWAQDQTRDPAMLHTMPLYFCYHYRNHDHEISALRGYINKTLQTGVFFSFSGVGHEMKWPQEFQHQNYGYRFIKSERGNRIIMETGRRGNNLTHPIPSGLSFIPLSSSECVECSISSYRLAIPAVFSLTSHVCQGPLKRICN